MKNARRRAARGEEDFSFSQQRETGIAGSKCAFSTQSRGPIVSGKRIPVFAVRCSHQKELAFDGIAENKTLFFREAGDGVEKKLFANVRVLQTPRLAAVGGFVKAGFVAFAAGHDVGAYFVEGHDAAKIQRVAIFHMEALPGLAF